MKRKIFEFGDDLAAAFEQFCGERGFVEKRVVESMVAYFMQQNAATREQIMMTRYERPERYQSVVVPRKAAKPATGQKSTPSKPGSPKRSKPGDD